MCYTILYNLCKQERGDFMEWHEYTCPVCNRLFYNYVGSLYTYKQHRTINGEHVREYYCSYTCMNKALRKGR